MSPLGRKRLGKDRAQHRGHRWCSSFAVFPVYWMVATAFKPNDADLHHRLHPVPDPPDAATTSSGCFTEGVAGPLHLALPAQQRDRGARHRAHRRGVRAAGGDRGGPVPVPVPHHVPDPAADRADGAGRGAAHPAVHRWSSGWACTTSCAGLIVVNVGVRRCRSRSGCCARSSPRCPRSWRRRPGSTARAGSPPSGGCCSRWSRPVWWRPASSRSSPPGTSSSSR